MLHFINVRKNYKSFLALDIPELTIYPGLWWLQGLNGSGKTTFLKILGGILPFSGTISFNQLTIRKNRKEFLQHVSFAEAEPLYPPFLTGHDLVRLYCKTKGVSSDDTINLMQQLNIEDALLQPISTYSSGMVKKLSVALAFSGNPSLILLDEPFITIDAEAVKHLQDTISEKHRQGVSFIISSHQATETAQLGFSGTLQAFDGKITKAVL